MDSNIREYRKVMFDMLVAVILAAIAAIAVDLLMHAQADLTQPACDANVHRTRAVTDLQDCGGDPAIWREVRL